MSSKSIYTIAAVVVVLAAGIIFYSSRNSENVSDDQAQTQQPGPADQLTQDKPMTNTDPCADGSQKDANGRFKPSVDIANKTVTMETSMGTFQLELFDKDAPKTVQNFVCLVQKGYYDNIKFHRVAHGFVIQAGDPTGTGSGGESIFGEKFEDELYPDTASYKTGYIKGTLAMANAGPNTNGSQFFIMTSDLELPHNYTIFGKVKSGLDVVEKIGAVPVNPGFGPEDGPPKTDIIIKKATVN
jgi:cyclophilin family peptidyl-prolyl cis-trans isomerase